MAVAFHHPNTAALNKNRSGNTPQIMKGPRSHVISFPTAIKNKLIKIFSSEENTDTMRPKRSRVLGCYPNPQNLEGKVFKPWAYGGDRTTETVISTHLKARG